MEMGLPEKANKADIENIKTTKSEKRERSK